MTKDQLLDFILGCIPSAAECGITFDYDDFDDGTAYLTTQDGDFKLKIEKVGLQ